MIGALKGGGSVGSDCGPDFIAARATQALVRTATDEQVPAPGIMEDLGDGPQKALRTQRGMQW